jgi:gamma-glutamyltranspeptidase
MASTIETKVPATEASASSSASGNDGYRVEFATGGGGMEVPFISRRSPIMAINGAAASSQPYASQIGLRILQQGLDSIGVIP